MSSLDLVLWRRLDVPGHDFCELKQNQTGFVLSGVANFLSGRKACSLSYVVMCSGDWITKSAVVKGQIGRAPVEVDLRRDANCWKLNGEEQPQVAGCVDIDLAFTPATNTLPMRRLRLKRGQAQKVVAAWLMFPSLKLTQLHQTYELRNGGEFRYTSNGGRFQATIATRPSKLVSEYSGLWMQEQGL